MIVEHKAEVFYTNAEIELIVARHAMQQLREDGQYFDASVVSIKDNGLLIKLTNSAIQDIKQ